MAREEVTDQSLNEVVRRLSNQTASLMRKEVDRGGAQGFQKLTGVWPGD